MAARRILPGRPARGRAILLPTRPPPRHRRRTWPPRPRLKPRSREPLRLRAMRRRRQFHRTIHVTAFIRMSRWSIYSRTIRLRPHRRQTCRIRRAPIHLRVSLTRRLLLRQPPRRHQTCRTRRLPTRHRVSLIRRPAKQPLRRLNPRRRRPMPTWRHPPIQPNRCGICSEGKPSSVHRRQRHLALMTPLSDAHQI